MDFEVANSVRFSRPSSSLSVDAALPVNTVLSAAFQQLDITSLDRFMAVDPASGKERRVEADKARQAIVVVAADWVPRIFTLVAWAGRLSTDDFIRHIISLAETWKPRVVGIEASGTQSLFVDAVSLFARQQGKQLPIVPVKQPTDIEKDFRLRTTIEPILNDDRLFIRTSQEDLLYELRGFPTARWKDLVDCLATVVNLIPPRSTKRQKDNEYREYAKYLRTTGLPGRVIEEKLRAFETEKEKPSSVNDKEGV